MSKRKLTDDDVRAIRRARQTKVEGAWHLNPDCRVEALARRFGVSKRVIADVANRRTYRDVSDEAAP